MPRIALLAVIASAVLAQSAGAATVNVQNQHDNGNGSLRKAIADANPNDEILVPPGTYNLKSGELDVGKNLQIIGAGAGVGASGNTIIDAGGKSRVFNIHDGTVTLKDMRITGGKADQGGGIYEVSTVILDGVVVTGNVAGGNNVHGEGGGIFTNGQVLALVDSAVTGNRAGGGGATGSGVGGGIKVGLGNGADRQLELNRSVIRGNTAGGNGSSGYGGGIDASGEGTNTKLEMSLADTTVAGNVAGAGNESFGGGIEAGSGNTNSEMKITIDVSTISGNRTKATGGAAGIDFQSGAANVDQTLTMANATIAGNVAEAGGTGGLTFRNVGGGSTSTETLTHVTIANNTGTGVLGAATATAHNTIVAKNTTANCDFPFASTSHDLEDTDTCGLDTNNGDKPSTDPKLNPLGNYGGPTQTLLPRADSPALNAAESLYCPLADQRGVPRPQGAECDIGADEAQIADVALTATRTPKTVSAGKVVTYKFAVKNKGPQVAEGVTLVDKLPAKLTRVSVAGCAGNLATGCVIGTVPFGVTKTVTVKARALRSGKVTNTSRVTTFAADPVAGNNAASTSLTILPSLTALSMTPKTWSLGEKTTIRFTLSDPGTVTLAFARKGDDGKFHKVGARKVNGKRGKNKLSFDGHLDGGKVLKPGSYRLTARVKDAGGRRSKPARLKFKLTS